MHLLKPNSPSISHEKKETRFYGWMNSTVCVHDNRTSCFPLNPSNEIQRRHDPDVIRKKPKWRHWIEIVSQGCFPTTGSVNRRPWPCMVDKNIGAIVSVLTITNIRILTIDWSDQDWVDYDEHSYTNHQLFHHNNELFFFNFDQKIYREEQATYCKREILLLRL